MFIKKGRVIAGFLILGILVYIIFSYYYKNYYTVNRKSSNGHVEERILGSVPLSDGTCIQFLEGHRFDFFSNFSGELKKEPCRISNMIAKCEIKQKNYIILFYQNNRYADSAKDYCHSLMGKFITFP